MVDTSLAVVGAGPYGLAVAASARHLAVEPVVLGEPMGFWPRMPEGIVHRHPHTEVMSCVEQPNGDIRAELSNGEVLLVDHVVLATGYRADIAAVPYLRELSGLETVDGFPVLGDQMQTSVPGLFITGFAATHDFGPFFGFVRGCPAAAQIIGCELARILESPIPLADRSH